MPSKIDTTQAKIQDLEKRLAAEKEKLTSIKKAEEIKKRKASTQQKIKVGGSVLAVLRNVRNPEYDAKKGYDDGYIKYDEFAIADFLNSQEKRGHYFSDFVNKWHSENDSRLSADEARRREEKNAKRREKRQAEKAEENNEPVSGFFNN